MRVLVAEELTIHQKWAMIKRYKEYGTIGHLQAVLDASN